MFLNGIPGCRYEAAWRRRSRCKHADSGSAFPFLASRLPALYNLRAAAKRVS
jgi:hypothetical protein